MAQSRNRRILGIDPGTASTGFGCVDQCGSQLQPVWYDCLTTRPTEAPAARLLRIHRAVADAIEHLNPM